MSKRTRGQQRRRPGARPTAARPSQPSRPRPERILDAAGPPPADAAGVARPLEASAASTPPVEAEPATPATPATRVRSGHPRPRAKPGSLLASRAATEYVYVAQDLRRITLVALVLFGLLIGLWVVLVPMGLSDLY